MRNKYWKKILPLALVLIFAGQINTVTAFATGDENDTLTAEVNYSGMDGSNEPEIIEEIVALRTENEKHFLMSDGSYMVMQYMNAVHYKDSDGEWRDIKNSLSAGSYRNQKAYTLRAGAVSKAFSASGDSTFLFSIERYGCILELGPRGKSQSLEATQETTSVDDAKEFEVSQVSKSGAIKGQVSELAYENVLPNAKLVYANSGYDTTESIVIPSKQDNYSYSFDLNLSGLEAKIGENGDLSFTNTYGELLYKLRAPYMVDFAGAVSNTASYRVDQEGGQLVLTITPDSAWMNARNRIYPVTLSSLFECRPNETDAGAAITHLPQGSSNTSRGPEEELYFGYSCSEAVNESRICIGFDSFPRLPDTAELVQAKVKLLQTSFSEVLCEEAEIGIYSADMTASGNNAEWLRGLTWDSKSTASNFIAKTVCSENTTDKFLTWDITDYARQWQSNGGSARSFMLQLEDIQTYSKSHAMIITLKGSRALDTPLLMVRYRADTVEENIAAETAEECRQLLAGSAGTVHVGDEAEGMILVGTDLLMKNGGSFTLERVYNFDSREWRLSLYETLEEYTLGASECIVHTDGTGAEHIYLPAGAAGTYIAADGENQILVTHNGGEKIYELTDSEGGVKRFINGCLAAYTKPEGETLLIAYNNTYSPENDDWKPTGVGKGQIVQLLITPNIEKTPSIMAEFEYENDGMLSRILCCGEEIKYKYTANDSGTMLLTGMESSMGTVVEYQYDLSGWLNRAIDRILQNGIGVTYTDEGEISRVFEFMLEPGKDAPNPGKVITFGSERQTDMAETTDTEQMSDLMMPDEPIFEEEINRAMPHL